MNENFIENTCKALGREIFKIEEIQTLWSGYGKIMRYGLKGEGRKSVVIKHVKLPDQNLHPRGWNTDRSHQRKIRSYQVETLWYDEWAQLCDENCPVPRSFLLESSKEEFLMVLEDLNESGYPLRKASPSIVEMGACLKWLANFHAIFMNKQPHGLWPVGTYWHLETRPDELELLEDLDLKKMASKIDRKLKDSPYQTFVHGDAKVANFCFSLDGKKVAAVDFQYVGGGCGMKDVVYFIGSCLHEKDCGRFEKELLKEYFMQLENGLRRNHSNLDFEAIEKDWRALYPVAWADFHRFMKGWSPGHWKIHGYSEAIARNVVEQLNIESA